jgi:peptidoglycan hydrolase-like amidase
MNEKWKQLLGSFMLGVMMPMLVLHFASLTRRASGVQPETTITVPTVSTQMPTQAPAALPVYLPVLTGNTVVTMELDTYLVGVLLGEMPAYFEEEALMAQAVVARTYTLYHQVRRDKHAGGAVCTDPGCCQAYVSETVYVERGGSEADVEKIRKAVEEKATEIKAYVVKDTLEEITLRLGELTDDEREIILKGCLINYNRA